MTINRGECRRFKDFGENNGGVIPQLYVILFYLSLIRIIYKNKYFSKDIILLQIIIH